MLAIPTLSRKRIVLPNLSVLSLHGLGKQSHRNYATNIENLEYPSTNTNHNDLSSFLEYAARIGMDSTSTVYIGTHYEYIVQSALKGFAMSLKRNGGKSDYGIDLLGTWSLPSMPHPLKVLIQCKGHAGKISPSLARELEGAFVGAPPGWRGSSVLALLVSQNVATKGMREALGRSRWPMGYVYCSREGKVLQMLWNKRAAQEGLEGIGIGVRYAGEGPNERHVILTWQGNVLNV